MTRHGKRTINSDDLVVGALAGKVTGDSEIARTEKALIQIKPETLYIPILFEGIEIGGVFLGSGNVILDAIVETRQGAYGESQEFPWVGSLFFLSRGKDWFPPVVDPVKEKELKKFNLDSAEAAQERAKEIFARFVTDRRSWFIDWFVPRNSGWYTTILDKDRGKINVIAHNDKIVLRHHDLKLVVAGNRLVRKEGDRKVLVVGHRGPVIRLG